MSSVFADQGDKPLDKGRPDEAFTAKDREVMETLRKVMLLPNEFKDYLVQYIALNQPPIPIGQIFGYSQTVPQSATFIVTGETRTSSTFGDLATVGPTLTGLPDGKYLFLYGCDAAGDPGVSNAQMSIQVNATAAATNDAASTSAAFLTSIMKVVEKTLAGGGNNTVTAKFRSSNNVFACSFSSRFLIGLRTGNS